MNKYGHLIKVTEIYAVKDPVTRGEFEVIVTESESKIHYQMDIQGVFSSSGISVCIDLLKQLVTADCFSVHAQEGEKEAKKKPANKLSSNIKQLIKDRNNE